MRSSGVSREAFIANEERKSRSCAAFALAGGLALIIAGSVIMRRADYGHVKSHLVEEYNKGERHQTPCTMPGFSSLGTRTYFPAPTTIGSDPSPHSSSP